MFGIISLGTSPSTSRFLSQFVPRVCSKTQPLSASFFGSRHRREGADRAVPLRDTPDAPQGQDPEL